MGCLVVALLAIGAVGESGRRLAQEMVCLGNNEVLLEAWLAYANDNDGALVGGHTNPGQWVGRSPAPGSVDQETDAIRRGVLFGYVDDLNAYHCPADRILNDYPVFRTYSIAGGANGETWAGYDKAKVYSDLESPSAQYIFVEMSNPRGSANTGSWQMHPGSKIWVDPLAMWHEESTTLGFAEGHAEVHRWHDESFVDWCHRAMDPSRPFTFNMTPPADEQRDVEYMAQGFPYESLW